MRLALTFTFVIWAIIVGAFYKWYLKSESEYWANYRIEHKCLVMHRSLPYDYIVSQIDSEGIKHITVKTKPVKVSWACNNGTFFEFGE